jgi:ATP-binding cassette subfamily B protein
VLAALLFMVGAKLANVGVPVLLKHLVDALTLKPATRGLLVVPVGLLLAYGLLRLSTSLFTELRELVFAKATQGARAALRCDLRAPACLSLRFHLERQTGGMTRDIERGVRGIESLISYSLYSILPTLIEVALVLGIWPCSSTPGLPDHAGGAGVLHHLHRQGDRVAHPVSPRGQRADSAAHTKAIDSLLNYETVKYFNNEAFEARATTRTWSACAACASRARPRCPCSTPASSSSSPWRWWPCCGAPRRAWWRAR